MNKFNHLLAQRISDLRREFGFKQDYMARELKITQQAYSKLEKGVLNFSPNLIVKLSEIFKCSIEELLSSNKQIRIINSPQANMFNNSIQNDSVIVVELINSKDKLIESLQAQIELLKKIK